MKNVFDITKYIGKKVHVAVSGDVKTLTLVGWDTSGIIVKGKESIAFLPFHVIGTVIFNPQSEEKK